MSVLESLPLRLNTCKVRPDGDPLELALGDLLECTLGDLCDLLLLWFSSLAFDLSRDLEVVDGGVLSCDLRGESLSLFWDLFDLFDLFDLVDLGVDLFDLLELVSSLVEGDLLFL